MKKLKNLNLKGKKVLLRVDINSDVIKGKLIPSQRIKQTANTIKYLKQKKAKITIIAHQGNPRKKDFISLKQHAKQINKHTKIKFINDITGKKAINAINNLKEKQAILLENIRFNKDEFNPRKKNNQLIKTLSPLFDLFINDAFSVCHRDHTSVTGFPKKITSTIGPLIEKELKALKKISLKNAVYILGGGKPETNIKLLKGNKVLACGFFGQLCLIAKGKNLGYQNKYLKKEALIKDYDKLIKKLKTKLKDVETPVDFALNINNKRKEFSLEEFPLNHQIDDIGEKTIKKYKKIIKKTKAIYMKGPAGLASNKKFAKGTIELLKASANSKAFTIVGGGHLTDAIYKYKIPIKKFNHISFSGGALLNYIANEKLPGLKAIGFYKN